MEASSYPPSVSLSPEGLVSLLRNGYELRLCNRKELKASSQMFRLLYPVVPVLGATLGRDFNFRIGRSWVPRAEEAGSLRVKIELHSDLTCDFEASPGVLLQIPEVFTFIQHFVSSEEWSSQCRALFSEFQGTGLADGFSKLCRSPLLATGKGLHLAACFRVISLIDERVLRPARHALLDCRDFSKEGLRRFCLANGGTAKEMRQSKQER